MQGFLSDLFGGSGSHESQQPVNPEDLDEEGAATHETAHHDADDGAHAPNLDATTHGDAAANPAEDAGGDLL